MKPIVRWKSALYKFDQNLSVKAKKYSQIKSKYSRNRSDTRDNSDKTYYLPSRVRDNGNPQWKADKGYVICCSSECE